MSMGYMMVCKIDKMDTIIIKNDSIKKLSKSKKTTRIYLS